MSDDILVARERARELVGERVWIKLSGTAQANALFEELRVLNAERAAAAVAPSTRAPAPS